MAVKKCEKCDYSLGYNMKFCPVCGTAAPVLSTEYSSEPQQHGQPQLYPEIVLYPKPARDLTLSEQKKKGLKPWLITTIICSAVTVTVIISLSLFLFIGGNKKAYNESTSRYGYEYTTGYTKDGYYKNLWANISFPTDQFPNSNKNNIYEIYEHNPGEIGGMQFAFVSLDQYSPDHDFILAFENVGENFDEEDYISLMTVRFQVLYSEEPTVDLSEREIAGETYTVAELSGTFVKKYFCIRIQDNYAICFITDAGSYDELNNIEEAIK